MNIKDDIANMSITGEFKLGDYFELEEDKVSRSSDSSSSSSSSS